MLQFSDNLTKRYHSNECESEERYVACRGNEGALRQDKLPLIEWGLGNGGIGRMKGRRKAVPRGGSTQLTGHKCGCGATETAM